ncbi:MAG: polysaccharide deacetylase family protein [bacterium]|nr:polysaccharide deacetylase family protein [bacterium]
MTSARTIPVVLVGISAVLAGFGFGGCQTASIGDSGTGPGDDPDDLADGDETPVIVNFQIDAELEDVEGLNRIIDALQERDLKATVFVTADYANREAFRIGQLFDDGFEIALHGFNTGETLASMTADEQQDLLGRAMTAVEGCDECGTGHPVVGFRPQYFSQNEDTYGVLDEMGIRYNCGFKAGLLAVEGHEEEATPYLVEGHNFYAVPFTTVEYEGKDLYLCDIANAMAEELTAEQWGEVLQMGLDQCAEREEPFVILLHGWYTGDTEQYDYWDPFLDILEAAAARGRFVTTGELVDLYAD